ncbi:MAG: hypothetical protein EXR39_05475 [Betaproteobacteria bacterium]|nr:hypothetical protein [Betaproteobacteria bacterium]
MDVGGTKCGIIVTSVFSTFTTVTLTMDLGEALVNPLSSLSYGILNSLDSSIPGYLHRESSAARSHRSKLADVVSVFDFMTPAQIADVQAGTLLVDVNAAIQAAINSRQSLHFPAGKYLISKSLLFRTVNAPSVGFWRGDGMNYSNPQVSTRQGPSTTLFWGGSAGSTMVEATGLAEWGFSNMSFAGRKLSTDTNRTGILFLFKMHARLGVSTYYFDRVRFEDSDVCMQCGVVQADTNCDTLTFEQCIIANSRRGLLVKNDQGLLYMFNH